MASYAQDRVYRKDGETLQGKVLEVHSKEIVMQSSDDGLVYYVDQSTIVKIMFENGRVEWIHPPPKVYPYRQQRRWALKATTLAPFSGMVGLSSQWSWNKQQSTQLDVYHIFAATAALDFSPQGWSVALSQRWYAGKPNKRKHRLMGYYLQPQVYWVSIDERHPNEELNNAGQVVKYRFIMPEMRLGYQHVFSNRFVMDVSYGLGIPLGLEVDDERYDPQTSQAHFGNIHLRKGIPVAFNAEFSLGILLF
jgi:hypothetical protein